MQEFGSDAMMPELDQTLSESIQQQITHAHMHTHTHMHNVRNSVHISIPWTWPQCGNAWACGCVCVHTCACVSVCALVRCTCRVAIELSLFWGSVEPQIIY